MKRHRPGAGSTDGFADLSLAERVAHIRAMIDGRIVFTTSFGLEDQAIAHAVFTQNLGIDVVTLDTGRLFPETYALWAETERRYGRRIASYHPRHDALETLVAKQGVNGFHASVENRKSCCFVRKVEPLGRALGRASAWITGLRAQQSRNRAAMAFFEFDRERALIKANPLLDWSREAVAAYVVDQCIPANPLHEAGFLSIGCQPCTRAVRPGEPERAGRWWWEQEGTKECGLHLCLDAPTVRRLA